MKETRPCVNAAVRAIDLIQAMNRRPVSTIHWLHQQTGIPKPSIVRMLHTLESRDIVRHAPQYGAYMLASNVVSLSCGYHGCPRIVEAAACPLDELTQRIQWPAAVAVYEQDAMVVRYSTIPHSPLALLQSSINMRLSLVSRAMGRAYLAFCTPQQQDVILAMLESSRHPEDAAARDRQGTRTMLEAVAAQGYALRNPAVRPVSSTLAIPIQERGRVVASLGVTWITSALSVELAVGRYLSILRETAGAISLHLQQPEAQDRHSRSADATFHLPKSSDKAFAPRSTAEVKSAQTCKRRPPPALRPVHSTNH